MDPALVGGGVGRRLIHRSRTPSAREGVVGAISGFDADR